MWSGSSPRLRGTHRGAHLGESLAGIIPALAGNTSVSSHCGYPRGDHPRACGEHAFCACVGVAGSGSSPRLRGTHVQNLHGELLFGIIPALAGNTFNERTYWAILRDHPRACGEHSVGTPPDGWGLGSSPRLRGTRGVAMLAGAAYGIIPALAGNTRFHSTQCCVTRDHPRACGEHILGRSTRPIVLGSSPRLRGTLCQFFSVWACRGIIPALAGNTSASASSLLMSRDHPRACGEHVASTWLSRSILGSSPRLRGTRI